MSDRGEGKNDSARANCGVAGQAHMGDKPDLIAELRVGDKSAIGPNLGSRPEPSAGFDDGARMDCVRHSRTSIAETSASQTSTPSTFASPRNHPMLRRL